MLSSLMTCVQEDWKDNQGFPVHVIGSTEEQTPKSIEGVNLWAN